MYLQLASSRLKKLLHLFLLLSVFFFLFTDSSYDFITALEKLFGGTELEKCFD